MYDYNDPKKVIAAYNDIANKISLLYKEHTPHSLHSYVLDRVMHNIEMDIEYISDIEKELDE